MLEHGIAKPVAPNRAVVIGAAGFIGSAVSERLKRDGVDVLAIGRQAVDLLAQGSAERLADLIRPTDSVVVIAAKAPARDTAAMMLNLRMAETVWTALSAVKPAHLLYVSSDAVYLDDANPVTEESPIAPSTPHGMMHAARELMFRSVGVPYAVLRPTLVYGRKDPHSGYGPNRFRREAEAGGPIRIFGEGEERRDHIAVEDVAALASLILAHRSTGTLNAVTGVSTPFFEIARQMAELYNTTVESIARPVGWVPHLLHRHFAITACYRAFPRFHFTALDDGLRQLAAGSPG